MPSSNRFAFGKNWASFLESFDEARLDQAIDSLKGLLRLENLEGKRFLDIGSGSGLFSLAAYRLGGDVVSMDFDPQCVECTRRLKTQQLDDRELLATPARWTIQSASVLDRDAMESLGTFDVVYSWGVLHHTGAMVNAIENACQRVGQNGHLAIAIYNDQGGGSRRWHRIKTGYQRMPTCLRPGYVGVVAGWYEAKFALARLARGGNPLPFSDWKAKKQDRGMSVWHDWVDWVGGLPFEVAKPEAIIMPMLEKGFQLQNLTTVGSGWGCNEYVFRRL